VSAPGEGIFSYWPGEIVDLVAKAAEGYHFINWTGGVGTIGNVNAAVTTITMNNDYSISADFEVAPPVQYNLIISSTAGGSVTTPGVGTFTYGAGTVVNLVAAPNANCRFVNWTGDVSTVGNVSASSTTITMNGDYSIIAGFEEAFAGGSGTLQDPYQITNWHHLHNMRYYLNSYLILMNNLDSTTSGYTEMASSSAAGGKGWQPIGTSGNRFTGTFDGQGYEIRDLFINRPDEGYVGLFGAVGGIGVIKNLGMVNIDVTGHGVVGGLVAMNDRYGSMNNCYSRGSVTGTVSVGGLVGYSAWTVSNSHSSASVTGDQRVGGLVGMMGALGGSVTNSYFTGSVTGSSCVGGLVGDTPLGTVSNSYYNFDEVLINGENIITIGALFDGDFDQWLDNNKFLDVNDRLSQNSGYYVINDLSDFKQLLAFGQNGSLKFRLEGGLDLATEPDFYIPYLAGEFDGSGHEISNLNVNLDFIAHIALFGHLAPGGKVTRMGVENVDITGYIYVGGLAGYIGDGAVSNSYSSGRVGGTAFVGGLVGYNYVGNVSNSHFSGNVTGDYEVGGLAGCNYEGTVSNSYFSGIVTSTGFVAGLVGENFGGTVSDSHSNGTVTGTGTTYAVGGLVGESNGGTISNSCFDGTVTGDDYVGGLVGCNVYGGTVSNSYSTGSVIGNYYVGGLMGLNEEGTVSDSYSSADATGTACVGGLVGKNDAATVSNSYATGTVTRFGLLTNASFGGFIGYNYQGKIIKCYSTGSVHYEGFTDSTNKGFAGEVDTGGEYDMAGNLWDIETSGQTSTAGDATGKTTTQMKSISTFSGATWNIIAVANPSVRNLAYIWNIVNNVTYPFLSWQPVS